MKKLLIFTMFLCMSLSIYSYSHAFHHSYHPHVSRPVVHRSHHTNVTHTAPKVRTAPLKKQSIQPIKHKYGPNASNIMLWYLIARPHHSSDTYNVDNKELKVCPICHKKLIPLNWKVCNRCRR